MNSPLGVPSAFRCSLCISTRITNHELRESYGMIEDTAEDTIAGGEVRIRNEDGAERAWITPAIYFSVSQDGILVEGTAVTVCKDEIRIIAENFRPSTC